MSIHEHNWTSWLSGKFDTDRKINHICGCGLHRETVTHFASHCAADFRRYHRGGERGKKIYIRTPVK